VNDMGVIRFMCHMLPARGMRCTEEGGWKLVAWHALFVHMYDTGLFTSRGS